MFAFCYRNNKTYYSEKNDFCSKCGEGFKKGYCNKCKNYTQIPQYENIMDPRLTNPTCDYCNNFISTKLCTRCNFIFHKKNLLSKF